MPAHIREYQRAPDVERALTLMERDTIETAPLIPRPRMPDAGFPSAAAVVDLRELPWDYISREPAVLRIGANTLLQILVENAAVRNVAGGVLSQAAHLAAPRTLRNLATLAGALEGVADGPPEVALALLALDATATVQGSAAGHMPLLAYLAAPAGLLAEVIVDLNPPAVAALARVARTPLDQAIVAAVGVVAGQIVRVAVSGASALPLVVQSALDDDSDVVIARLVEQVAGQANPIGDYRGGADYRRKMAAVLTRRVLETAFHQGVSA